MPLFVHTGNALDATDPVIAEGCNCLGAHGAGFARQISTRFPTAVASYKDACKAGRLTPGRCILVQTSRSPLHYVAFLATQHSYGRPRPGQTPFAKPQWISEAFKSLSDTCSALGLPSVAIPPIGAGLGGLDWATEVAPAINQGIAESGLIVNAYFLQR